VITTITLTYDGGGHRVMKKVETWYLADDRAELLFAPFLRETMIPRCILHQPG
jgi:hypothetical protein